MLILYYFIILFLCKICSNDLGFAILQRLFIYSDVVVHIHVFTMKKFISHRENRNISVNKSVNKF